MTTIRASGVEPAEQRADAHDASDSRSAESDTALSAMVARITPGDHKKLVKLLETMPSRTSQILADAAKLLGNSTVQRAIETIHAERGAAPDSHDGGVTATHTANAFYAAFAQRDTGSMRSFYAPGVRFHDPLFGLLTGADEVMTMWTSIMPKANPFQITPTPAGTPTLRSDGAWEVHVVWDAVYGLGSARIHNHSNSTLVIADGHIIEHRDVWDLDRWTAQALPHHLGGHVVTDTLAAAAAHSYIKIIDLIERHHAAAR
jgi:limonene-1,2-epoxide hydrolase